MTPRATTNTAAAAIAEHTSRGGLEDGLVFDAVRVRLIEIGAAVKATASPIRLSSISSPTTAADG